MASSSPAIGLDAPFDFCKQIQATEDLPYRSIWRAHGTRKHHADSTAYRVLIRQNPVNLGGWRNKFNIALQSWNGLD